MDPRPIPFSSADLERQRLESTIDQDLHSLSLTTITSSSDTPTARAHDQADSSFSSLSTIEYPRAEPADAYADRSFMYHHHHTKPQMVGPHGTPRAAHSHGHAARKVSERSLMEASPVSTAGHHVSAVTLAEGVFTRPMGGRVQHEGDVSGSEWDPDRSLGRLVGELGKVMQSTVSPRPTSPFSPTRSPRSPSPYTSSQLNPNLSFTLNRADPLPSPPQSRSGSGSSSGSRTHTAMPNPARKALGESSAHNIPVPTSQHQHHQSQKPKTKGHEHPTRRPVSAPAPGARMPHAGDVTGMTGLLDTPARGTVHDLIGKNGDVGVDAAGGIPSSLATLHARLRALETENSVSRRRVRELEAELERAKADVDSAAKTGRGRLEEVLGEKSALEDLVKSLRTELSRLTAELENHKSIVADLRALQAKTQAQAQAQGTASPRSEVTRELVSLRKEVERLSAEVHRLGGFIERGIETRKKARGDDITTIREGQEDLITLSDEDVQRVQRDVERRSAIPKPQPQPHPQEEEGERQPSKLRQGLHRTGSPDPDLAQPTPLRPNNASRSKPTPKRKKKAPAIEQGPSSPFPSIREEDEEEFFDVSRRATVATSSAPSTSPTPPPLALAPGGPSGDDNVPPQTVLSRVIAELESDFKHYKAIYAELAEQYKVLDAASAVAKRHVLAQHLKEVIDTLEQKADQIASLYGLLTFRDVPADCPSQRPSTQKSVPDILRMVRDTLGDEGIKRLERDGVLDRQRSSGQRDR